MWIFIFVFLSVDNISILLFSIYGFKDVKITRAERGMFAYEVSIRLFGLDTANLDL